ncbi:hypothetical protein FSP39_002830 [Pinctada imbricata]|uniref:EF-hand domain-containing protein n=1 Tax=Pinctada imbricata TaxID=66713 RepID=A0AA88YMW9_PINIB|nr:hypothetical protein FSP39_002830 [Pinctada imbricata]
MPRPLESKVSKSEVERLLLIHRDHSKPRTENKKGFFIDRATFNAFFHKSFCFTDTIISDRVFRVFDKDNDGHISEMEWIRGMSIFLRGHLEEQVKFCFEVYDMNGDGYISREEMFTLLKSSLVKGNQEEDPDEGVKDLVELVIKKLDFDHDSRISLNDFKTGIDKDPLMMESLGPCLPSPETMEEFSALISDVPNDGGMFKGKMKR